MMVVTFLFLINSLIPIECDGKWGYADRKGSVIIETIYDSTGLFHCGVAVVKIANKYGAINEKGIWLFQPQKRAIGDFDCDKELFPLIGTKKWTFLTKSGKCKRLRSMIFTADHNCKTHQCFQSGSARMYLYELDKKFGFIRYKCSDVSIDSCKEYLTPRYEAFVEIGTNLIMVKQESAWKLCDYFGKELKSYNYDQVNSPAKSLKNRCLYVIKKGNKSGILDEGGNEVLAPRYHQIEYNEHLGLWKVRVDNDEFYVTMEGKEIKCS